MRVCVRYCKNKIAFHIELKRRQEQTHHNHWEIGQPISRASTKAFPKHQTSMKKGKLHSATYFPMTNLKKDCLRPHRSLRLSDML
jgi:hypothetical protein